MSHIPVLLFETADFLNTQKKGIILDATLGEGGHSSKFLEQNPSIKIVGLDRDKEAIKKAEEKLEKYADRVTIVKENFRNLDLVLKDLKIEKIDGAVFDLGVSSLQLDSGERGFSFKQNAFLDMRMDTSKGHTASDILNCLRADELEDLLRTYGEERFAAKIASAICKFREKKKLETTEELAELVFTNVPVFYRHGRIHPATKTFQALRIAVNDELNCIKEALGKVTEYLNSGARLCVISFHSLEDRIVKRFFKEYKEKSMYTLLNKKPIAPLPEEIESNPRARSAKLRVGEKI
jgi:16S rRNA (cytosine1402-N4)-methyltransferase